METSNNAFSAVSMDSFEELARTHSPAHVNAHAQLAQPNVDNMSQNPLLRTHPHNQMTDDDLDQPSHHMSHSSSNSHMPTPLSGMSGAGATSSEPAGASSRSPLDNSAETSRDTDMLSAPSNSDSLPPHAHAHHHLSSHNHDDNARSRVSASNSALDNSHAHASASKPEEAVSSTPGDSSPAVKSSPSSRKIVAGKQVFSKCTGVCCICWYSLCMCHSRPNLPSSFYASLNSAWAITQIFDALQSSQNGASNAQILRKLRIFPKRAFSQCSIQKQRT